MRLGLMTQKFQKIALTQTLTDLILRKAVLGCLAGFLFGTEMGGTSEKNSPCFTKGLLGGLPPPQVEVFCIHGSEVLIHHDDSDDVNDGDKNDDKKILTHVTQVSTTERVIYPPGSFPPSLAARRQQQKPSSNKSNNLKVIFFVATMIIKLIIIMIMIMIYIHICGLLDIYSYSCLKHKSI